MTKNGLTIVALLGWAAFGTLPAQAQTYTVLHQFTGSPDGAMPAAGLIGDGAGGARRHDSGRRRIGQWNGI